LTHIKDQLTVRRLLGKLFAVRLPLARPWRITWITAFIPSRVAPWVLGVGSASLKERLISWRAVFRGSDAASPCPSVSCTLVGTVHCARVSAKVTILRNRSAARDQQYQASNDIFRHHFLVAPNL